MNEIVNKLLLGGDKFMLEMHLNNMYLLTVLVDHLLTTTKIKGEPNDNLADSESFKPKVKTTRCTDGNEKDFEIIVPLKYLSYFSENS